MRSSPRVGPRTDPVPALQADLVLLIQRHNLSPHLYADDTQIYKSTVYVIRQQRLL